MMGEPVDPFGCYRGRWRWWSSISAVAGGASDTSADDGSAGERRVARDTLVSTLDDGRRERMPVAPEVWTRDAALRKSEFTPQLPLHDMPSTSASSSDAMLSHECFALPEPTHVSLHDHYADFLHLQLTAIRQHFQR
jgi:hypothetical protein